MTLGLCNRFKSDGSICHNVCNFEDGWCREDDCAGFIRINSVTATLRDVLTLHAETHTKIPRRQIFETKVSQTNLANILGTNAKISVTQRAIDEFKGHHGGSSETAENSILSLFFYCLEKDIDVLRNVKEDFYLLRFEKFSISVLLTSMVRITSYFTLHRERTWEQVENGISSRIVKKSRPRSGAKIVSQLSSQEFSDRYQKLLELTLNDTYEGVVVNATNFGVFVYLECIDLQGLIHRSNLGKYSSNNPLTDEIWIPGIKIQAKLVRIDLEQLHLNFSLLKYDGGLV